MRVLGATIVTALLTQAAYAADYDYGPLRGSQYAPPAVAPVAMWEGAYFGATAGISQGNFEFGKSLRNSIAGLLRNTVLENEFAISNLLGMPSDDARGSSFGAFAGYNWQVDEIVFGIEVDYTRASLKGSSADAIGRSFVTSDGYWNEAYLNGAASTHLRDFGTLRARFGYAMGSFLPFVTGGLAVGRAEVASTAAVQIAGYHQAALAAAVQQFLQTGFKAPIPAYGYVSFNPLTLQRTLAAPVVVGVATTEKYAVGVSGGAGVDWQVLPNLFLRGEYQYINFGSFKDHKAYVNTVRAAAALKF
ncbi:MAG TPA: outer membrane beta-barrel protein [Beijerinckiaceae bacterium]|jgi:opacity protein-like surface antigen